MGCHQHYNFLVINCVLPDSGFPLYPRLPVLLRRRLRGCEETPGCAEGRVLQGTWCWLLSSLLEIAAVLLIPVFPTISVFQAFLNEYSASINTILSYVSPGLCNKTITAVTNSSLVEVWYFTVQCIYWNGNFSFRSDLYIHQLGWVFAAFILALINAAGAGVGLWVFVCF